MNLASMPNYDGMMAAVLPQCSDVDGHAHAVQFYKDAAFLAEELGGFIGSNLAAGGSAVVIATGTTREAVAEKLQSRGFNLVCASEQGRYIALDAAETLTKFMRDDWPDATLFTQVVGTVLGQSAAAMQGKNRRVSAFGEMVALLWAEGKGEAAIRLEQLWNNLARMFPLALRCAYPMSGFNREAHGDLFLKICQEHSRVIPVESYSTLETYEERLRSVSYLQHKAQALETEMAERKQVEEALRRTQAQLETIVEQRTSALRQLSSRLLRLQDTERRRIARELHDSLGQYLVGLKLNVDMLRHTPDNEKLWVEVEQLTNRCMAEVRTLSYLLHPPTMDAAGFASAARWYVEGFGRRSGIAITLDAPDHLGRLPDAVELALFRVLQEALTNVHRHSGATEAQVEVALEDGLVVLAVKDNGQGITEELLGDFQTSCLGMGVGLAGIRERAYELGGNLRIESDARGTMVQVAIPAAATI